LNEYPDNVYIPRPVAPEYARTLPDDPPKLSSSIADARKSPTPSKSRSPADATAQPM
jgi:hypothetical protein